jgi:hypothetical protein
MLPIIAVHLLLWAARVRFQEFEQVAKRIWLEAGMDADKLWEEASKPPESSSGQS